ncbi:MAG: TerD family protein [Spirulina sp. SIO3F2]|nr:TerD family protein [Spirulina sp. SIO3F2]
MVSAKGGSMDLTKGQSFNLTKGGQPPQAMFVGLGWTPQRGRQNMDLDASLFMLDANGMMPSQQHLIYFNNLISPDPSQSIRHLGDNLTGDGEGDDEQIIINLHQIPSNVDSLLVVINIYDALSRGQNFGQIEEAFVRLVNMQTQQEVCFFDLDEDFSSATSMQMAKIYRSGGSWQIQALGLPVAGGLQELINIYL